MAVAVISTLFARSPGQAMSLRTRTPVCWGLARGVPRKIGLFRGMMSERTGLRAFGTESGLPGLVVVDFDDTLTVGDTIARITALREGKVEGKEEKNEYRDALDAVVTAYLKDKKRLEGTQFPSLSAMLDAASTTEHNSIDRVESSEILKGLTRSELVELGQNIKLQDNVQRFLEAAEEKRVAVHVISANWSRDLIKGALLKYKSVQTITSSDLTFDSDGISTGKINRVVVSSFDKLEAFSYLRRNTPTIVCPKDLESLSRTLTL
ncbi:hypothetical protein AAMO2058_000780600 [Amorphochlora amoebiformis]